MRAWFPCAENRYVLHISIPPEKKRASWAALLSDFLTKGSISHRELLKLIGRLSFSQTLLFGKFGRTQLRPLYQKLHRRGYNARLTDAGRAVFGWCERVIRSFPPRIFHPFGRQCEWLVYTDAATSPPACAPCASMEGEISHGWYNSCPRQCQQQEYSSSDRHSLYSVSNYWNWWPFWKNHPIP